MRVQFELVEQSAAGLKTLMEKTGTETYKELFNNALTLLAWSVQQVEDGRVIAAVNENESKYKELVMPSLAAAERRRAAHLNKSNV